MKLIVGLGNPGRKYANTRHNVGFNVIAEVALRYGVGLPKARFHGETTDFVLGSEKVILLTPHTYMNESGRSVQEAMKFFQLDETTDLLIICDDFNLEFGRIRFRPKGSSGGQRGLEDVIARFGPQFSRLRVGIGSPPEGWKIPDYVLSKFREDELSDLTGSVSRAADAAICWAETDIQTAMNKFNAAQ